MPFLAPQGREEIEHFLIRKPMATLRAYLLRLSKNLRGNDPLEGIFAADPLVGWIGDTLLPKLNGVPTIDTVPEAFLVCQNVVDGLHDPPSSTGIINLVGIQLASDLRPTFFLDHEGVEDTPDYLYFGLRSRHQHDAVALKILLLPIFEPTLWFSIFVNQLAAHPVTGWAALPKAQGRPTALTDENFR